MKRGNPCAFYLQCWAYYSRWGCGARTAYWHRDAACCWHQLLQNTLSDFSGERQKSFLTRDITKASVLNKKPNNKKPPKPKRFDPSIVLHPVRGLTKESRISSYGRGLSNCSNSPQSFGELGLAVIKLMMFHTQFLNTRYFFEKMFCHFYGDFNAAW